jgi:hypothetical protein
MGSSKMDSSAVYALFEELKQKIDELGKKAKPKDQADSTLETVEIATLIDDLLNHTNQQQFTPEQIKVLQTNLAQYSAYSLSKVNESLRKVFTDLIAAITPIDEKINLIKSQQNLVIRNEPVFSVDFRNCKAVITIISMVLLILFSLSGNIWQFNRNSQLKDNDLKYRYIKSVNVITPENLYKLETIFLYQRDEKKIREIRGKVEDYENRIKANAEKIELKRLNNSTKTK